jgi:hypothetical protein
MKARTLNAKKMRGGDPLRTTSEIVNYLTRHYQEQAGKIEENLLPEQINDLAQQMGEFLAERLEEDTHHKVVWADFIENPEENAASVSGILEALFEAQHAVRDRVDGFMQAITALEAKNSDLDYTELEIEDKLISEPGDLIPEEGETSAIQADRKVEKNPPAFLYGNEQEGVESDRQAPVSKEFMVGKNAQIIYFPSEEMQFPFMFMQLGQLTDRSKDLMLHDKQIVQENLEEIRSELIGERPFDEEKMANAFETIWEVAPSYANALIESLINHIDKLPVETQEFILHLRSALHK